MCKVDDNMLPFSDDFDDYDTNKDGVICFEEFAFAVMKTIDLSDPRELEEPFFEADSNGSYEQANCLILFVTVFYTACLALIYIQRKVTLYQLLIFSICSTSFLCL